MKADALLASWKLPPHRLDIPRPALDDPVLQTNTALPSKPPTSSTRCDQRNDGGRAPAAAAAAAHHCALPTAGPLDDALHAIFGESGDACYAADEPSSATLDPFHFDWPFW